MPHGNKCETGHRIRLRGPWNVQNPAQRQSGEVSIVHFPQTWLAIPDGQGIWGFSRRFGCPTGIEPHETLWLEISSSAEGRAILNDEELGSLSSGTQSFEVTSRLFDGNHLDLELHRPEATTAETIIAEVALVIATQDHMLKQPPHDPPPSQ